MPKEVGEFVEKTESLEKDNIESGIIKGFDKFENNVKISDEMIRNSKWLENNPNLPNKLLKEADLPELTLEQIKVIEYIHKNVSK
jgi:hypothetical protein